MSATVPVYYRCPTCAQRLGITWPPKYAPSCWDTRTGYANRRPATMIPNTEQAADEVAS